MQQRQKTKTALTAICIEVPREIENVSFVYSTLVEMCQLVLWFNFANF